VFGGRAAGPRSGPRRNDKWGSSYPSARGTITARRARGAHSKRTVRGVARRGVRSRRSVRPTPTGPPSSYVRLEIDLVHEAFRRQGLPFVHRLEAIFREREVVEVEGLLRLVAGVLHALSSRGFSRVDHWEARPGGWIPLPEPAHERLIEPVGHLLNALRSGAWRRVAEARSFSARLSGAGEVRADFTVRRVHRERGHAITLELFGRTSVTELQAIERALRQEISIVRLRRAESSPAVPDAS